MPQHVDNTTICLHCYDVNTHQRGSLWQHACTVLGASCRRLPHCPYVSLGRFTGRACPHFIHFLTFIQDRNQWQWCAACYKSEIRVVSGLLNIIFASNFVQKMSGNCI